MKFLESIFGKKSTTTHYYYPPTTTRTTPYYYAKSSTTYSPGNIDASNDAFYLLKKTCSQNFDSTCQKHKSEMHDLVVRCIDLKKKSHDGVMVPACKEILSAYCYVFSNVDVITCLTNDHEVYVPGKRTFITTKTTSRSTIKINIITGNPITTTTRPTIKINIITNNPTTRPMITTPRTNPPKSNKYPFELIPGFTGTITSVNKN